MCKKSSFETIISSKCPNDLDFAINITKESKRFSINYIRTNSTNGDNAVKSKLVVMKNLLIA